VFVTACVCTAERSHYVAAALFIKLSELVSEVQVRKFGKFLEEYASQLKDVEDALEESKGDSWDLMLDPVAMEVFNEIMICVDMHACSMKIKS